MSFAEIFERHLIHILGLHSQIVSNNDAVSNNDPVSDFQACIRLI